MRRSIFVTGVAAMATMLTLPSVLQAHDGGTSHREGGSMMGPGMMNGRGQMGQMMDHCSRMMQGDSGRPNDQWRNGGPPADGQSEKKQ